MTRLPPVFLDSAAWIGWAEGTLPWPLDGRGAAASAGLGTAHTSDYVVLEAYSFIMRNHRKDAALRLLGVATGPGFVLHPSHGDLVDRAIGRARERPRKRELSLVDWTTALLMEDHGIRHILTTDRAFAQLGFTVLP